jgi:hypothetical protein
MEPLGNRNVQTRRRPRTNQEIRKSHLVSAPFPPPHKN